MWVRHKKGYYNLDTVISIEVDSMRHTLRVVRVDGDEHLMVLPEGLSLEEAHKRLTALLGACEPFACPDPIPFPGCGEDDSA